MVVNIRTIRMQFRCLLERLLPGGFFGGEPTRVKQANSGFNPCAAPQLNEINAILFRIFTRMKLKVLLTRYLIGSTAVLKDHLEVFNNIIALVAKKISKCTPEQVCI